MAWGTVWVGAEKTGKTYPIAAADGSHKYASFNILDGLVAVEPLVQSVQYTSGLGICTVVVDDAGTADETAVDAKMAEYTA